MVQVTKGVLIECDPAMKQLLIHLDETLKLGTRFVQADLDPTHLFISQDALRPLKEQIDDLMDRISVPVVEGENKN